MPEDKKAPENKKPEAEAPAEEAPILSEATKAEMKAGKASLAQHEKQQAETKAAADAAEPPLPPDDEKGHFPVAEGDDKYTGHPPTQKKKK